MHLLRLLIVGILLFNCSPVLFAQSWTNITPGFGYSYHGIHFADNNVGYCVGENGVVLRTSDGGDTWTDVGQSLNVSTQFFGVHCFSLDSAIVVGDYEPEAYRTTDGGITWDTLTIDPTYQSGFNDIHFIDGNTGFVTGHAGRLFKTDDFGDTWTVIQDFGTTILLDIEFVSNDVAYLGAYSGVFKSVDGGNSWTELQTTDLNIVHTVSFRNANHGIITGYSLGGDNVIAKTYDAGQTWDTTIQDIPAYYTGVHLVDSLNGFLIHNSGGSGTMVTEDGGYVWSEFQINQCSGLWSLHFPTDNVGYGAGHNGIVKYENLTIGVTGFEDEVPSLLVSPNPVQNSFTIKMENNGDNLVEVFGIDGKIIHTESFRSRASTSVDVSNWRAGVYIIRVENGDGVLHSRVVRQ